MASPFYGIEDPHFKQRRASTVVNNIYLFYNLNDSLASSAATNGEGGRFCIVFKKLYKPLFKPFKLNASIFIALRNINAMKTGLSSNEDPIFTALTFLYFPEIVLFFLSENTDYLIST